jgi:hypothetical protein
MQPDYMVVLEEPDTEAANSGQTNVNTPTGATAMLSLILISVQQAGVSNLRLGAGVGTWLGGYLEFIQGFVTLPVDFIDMRIYPVNDSFLPNALQIAMTAAAVGKPVSISECWLSKERDSEVGVISTDQVRARNPFSFWAPLDAYFIKTMQSLANHTQMLFMDPFNAEYYFAYQPYDASTETLTPAQILGQESSSVFTANQQALYTSTGISYHHSAIVPADTIPPSAPGGLSGKSGNPTTAFLHWTTATDNVGTAGYYILRNGSIVGTTANPYYQDFGLAESTTYTYWIEAFDLAGNISAPSQRISVDTAAAWAQAGVFPPSIAGGNANSIQNGTVHLAGDVTGTSTSVVHPAKPTRTKIGLNSGVTFKIGTTGLTALAYQGQSMLYQGHGSPSFVQVSQVDSSGHTTAASTTASSIVANTSANTVTATYPWGVAKTHYQASANKLLLTITLQNTTADQTINHLWMFPVGLQFPATPVNPSNTAAFNIDAPSSVWYNYGSGSVDLVNEDVLKPLTVGFWQATNPMATKWYLMLDTDPGHSVNPNWPVVNRPIGPGASDTYTISIRFGGPGSTEPVLAADIFSLYAATFPRQVRPPVQKKPIASLFVTGKFRPTFPRNPRGWFRVQSSGISRVNSSMRPILEILPRPRRSLPSLSEFSTRLLRSLPQRDFELVSLFATRSSRNKLAL